MKFVMLMKRGFGYFLADMWLISSYFRIKDLNYSCELSLEDQVDKKKSQQTLQIPHNRSRLFKINASLARATVRTTPQTNWSCPHKSRKFTDGSCFSEIKKNLLKIERHLINYKLVNFFYCFNFDIESFLKVLS